jgi:hypothetical protein
MRRSIFFGFLALAGTTGLAQPPAAEVTASTERPACKMLDGDQKWLDRSVAAWRYAAEHYGQFVVPSGARAIIGSSECVLRSDTALFPDKAVIWESIDGKGRIPIIEDFTMPLSPNSQALEVNGNAIFVMSTPTVWRKSEVPGGKIGLENLMTAVFIHETSHILQQKTYMAAFSAVAKANSLPEDFNDDSIQGRFKSDQKFASSIEKETSLLLAAAQADSIPESRKLARKALSLIKARRKQYFVGNDAFMSKAEDIFYTLEGSGQWLGYQWLVDPKAGNLPVADAMDRFGSGSGFWSQAQGMVLLMAVDRLDGGAWKRSAFGDGKLAGVELLEAALAPRRR